MAKVRRWGHKPPGRISRKGVGRQAPPYGQRRSSEGGKASEAAGKAQLVLPGHSRSTVALKLVKINSRSTRCPKSCVWIPASAMTLVRM